jgi:hypothetical protein
MSIVTVTQFKSYAKKLDGDVTVEALYQTYIDSAEAIVSDYLGYSPVQATYTAQTFYGDGYPYLRLSAKPITSLSSISVSGVSKNVSDFTIDGETIVEKYGNSFPIGSVVVATFQAGYTTIPALIQLTILRITALLSMEAGENIGVSSTTFDGGNTRSFINYTNFDKYLAAISQYQLLKLRRLAP